MMRRVCLPDCTKKPFNDANPYLAGKYDPWKRLLKRVKCNLPDISLSGPEFALSLISKGFPGVFDPFLQLQQDSGGFGAPNKLHPFDWSRAPYQQ
jgi:hypothetical protein